MSNHRPDAAEKPLRFGCGFLLAFGTAAILVLQSIDWPKPWMFCAAGGFGLVIGIVAIRYWDHIWEATCERVNRSWF